MFCFHRTFLNTTWAFYTFFSIYFCNLLKVNCLSRAGFCTYFTIYTFFVCKRCRWSCVLYFIWKIAGNFQFWKFTKIIYLFNLGFYFLSKIFGNSYVLSIRSICGDFFSIRMLSQKCSCSYWQEPIIWKYIF